MYVKRTLETSVKKATKLFPALLLVGPRQVGKTTLLQHLAKKEKRNYITLDDPLLRTMAKEEPALLLQRFDTPLLIDEIQYAPQLLPYIKIKIDKERKPGMFWLTGSQQFQLMQGISESLAGRVGILNLLGFSLEEIYNKNHSTPFLPTKAQLKKKLKSSPHHNLQEIYEIIWRGSFPAVWTLPSADKAAQKTHKPPKLSPADRDMFYSSYLQTYLQRDVRALAKVGEESTFLKFVQVTAARTGQLLNISDMARDAGITPPTAKYWLSILETSGIIYLLKPYHTNFTKRLIKTPKLYFLDTGLAAYLTEWSTPKALEAGAMSGAILETFILAELLKSYWHNGKQAPFYYYRDKDKREIDLLIVKDNKIYPLEFKKTASPNKNHIKHFKVLNNTKKQIAGGGLICLSETLLPIDEKNMSIPVWIL